MQYLWFWRSYAWWLVTLLGISNCLRWLSNRKFLILITLFPLWRLFRCLYLFKVKMRARIKFTSLHFWKAEGKYNRCQKITLIFSLCWKSGFKNTFFHFSRSEWRSVFNIFLGIKSCLVVRHVFQVSCGRFSLEVIYFVHCAVIMMYLIVGLSELGPLSSKILICFLAIWFYLLVLKTNIIYYTSLKFKKLSVFYQERERSILFY